MGFWVPFHIHNHVGANRHNFVLRVGLNIGQSLTHQISGIAFVLLIWINLGVDKVALSRHHGVVSQTYALIFQPKLISVSFLVVDHFWFHGVNLSLVTETKNTVLKNTVYLGDNLAILQSIPTESIDLIYIDPPFNTGRSQQRSKETTRRNDEGDRVGFKGKRYETVKSQVLSYDDQFVDYWAFLEPRLQEAHRLLKPTGTLYLHLDYRESHYAKVLLDAIFGPDNFLNEIIWAYDYGGKSKSRWPAKHDTILVFVKDPKQYYFDSETVDREPYMAPGLVTEEKVAKGKLPTDVWWHTIVSPTGKEKTGYPTQKPIGILRRIIQASSKEGDVVLDFFAGSGTTGVVANMLGRKFILVDQNPEALEVIQQRLEGVQYELVRA
jgi:site-specific DNA-methyltransferase (adenine-specific)